MRHYFTEDFLKTLYDYNVIYPKEKWDFALEDNMISWCKESIGIGNWSRSGSVYFFKYEKDAVLFKLKYV